MARGASFRRGEDAPPPLVQVRRESEITPSNCGDIDHRPGVAITIEPSESPDAAPDQRDSLIFGRGLRAEAPSTPSRRPAIRMHHLQGDVHQCRRAGTYPATRSGQPYQIPCQKWQSVGLARVRCAGGTLQSSTRCSSEPLSVSRSLPVLAATDAAGAGCSWSVAAIPGPRGRPASRIARTM
jgi:hypothetical protein